MLEGIVRNAGKHRINKEEKNLVVRIVLVEEFERLKELVVMAEDSERIDPRIKTDLEVNKDAFIYCIITINLDVNRQINKDKENKGLWLSKKLDSLITNKLIDRVGNITGEAWGMKEIKVTSAFLAGKSIPDTNTRNPDWIVVSCTKKNTIWVDYPTKDQPDNKERIAYVIKLKKPNYCLFLIKKELEGELSHLKPKLDKVGIKVLGVNDTPGNIDEIEDTDYEFLVIDDSIRNFSKNEERKYPDRDYKTFSIPLRENTRFPIRKLDMKDNEIVDLIKSNQDHPEEITNKIFGKWIQTVNRELGREKWEFSLFFEDTEEKAKSWNSNLIKSYNFKVLSKLSSIPKKVNIWRHSALEQQKFFQLKKERSEKEGPHFYQYASYGDSFLKLIFNINPRNNPFLLHLVANQIREMGLLDVLVVDERLSEIVYNRQQLLETLYWQGIDFAAGMNILGVRSTLASARDNTTENTLKKHFILKISFQENNLYICKIKNGAEERISRRHWLNGEVKENNKYYIFLIHQTRFNEILNVIKEKKDPNYSKDQLAAQLKEIFPVVIIHSGRGRPSDDELPTELPYMEYSAIEKYLVSEPSKFYLVQNIMSCKEIRK